MPFKSKAQESFMRAAANNKDFAKKAGISQKDAQAFVRDTNNKVLKGK